MGNKGVSIWESKLQLRKAMDDDGNDDERHHTEDSDGADLISGADFLHLQRGKKQNHLQWKSVFLVLSISLKCHCVVAVWLHLRHPLIAEAAEEDDGQSEDQHEDSHGDGDDLMHIPGSASVVADKEAAVADVRGRAAVEVHTHTHTQNFWACIPEGRLEPACTCRRDAALL